MYSINKIQMYKSNAMFIKIQSIYINDNIIFQAKQSIECNWGRVQSPPNITPLFK